MGGKGGWSRELTLPRVETPSIQPTWRTAALWRRSAAKFLDVLFFVVLCCLPPIGMAFQATFHTKNIGPLAVVFLLYPVMQALTTWKWQASIGKRIMSISVVSLDGRRLDWVDAFQRQVLPMAFLILFCLWLSEMLPLMPPYPPGNPSPEDIQAWVDKLQSVSIASTSKWLEYQQFSWMLLFGSLILGLIRPDHRTLQDIWSGTIVVEPRKAAARVV